MNEIYVLMEHELGESSTPIHAFTDSSDAHEWMRKNKTDFKYVEDADIWDNPFTQHWYTLVKVPIEGINQPL